MLRSHFHPPRQVRTRSNRDVLTSCTSVRSEESTHLFRRRSKCRRALDTGQNQRPCVVRRRGIPHAQYGREVSRESTSRRHPRLGHMAGNIRIRLNTRQSSDPSVRNALGEPPLDRLHPLRHGRYVPAEAAEPAGLHRCSRRGPGPTSCIPYGQRQQFKELTPPRSFLLPNSFPGFIRPPFLRNLLRAIPRQKRPVLLLLATL